MRNIAFILVAVFWGFGTSAQSLQSFGLKGKVKSIQEELNLCSNKNGKAQTKDCTSFKSETEFTADGYLIKKENPFLNEDITKEKIQTETGFFATIYKKEDGVSVKWIEQYYNKEDLLYKDVSYKDNGELFSTIEYFYNEEKMLVRKEMNMLDYKGIKEKAISYFNEFGTFSAVEFYHDDKLYSKEDFDIQYEFDEKGNWVHSKIVDKFSTSIHSRVITYY